MNDISTPHTLELILHEAKYLNYSGKNMFAQIRDQELVAQAPVQIRVVLQRDQEGQPNARYDMELREVETEYSNYSGPLCFVQVHDIAPETALANPRVTAAITYVGAE